MENMLIRVDGDVLTLTVDLGVECGFTGNRKNICVGTTGGNINLPGPDGTLRGEMVNCTVWRKLKPSERTAEEVYFKQPDS